MFDFITPSIKMFIINGCLILLGLTLFYSILLMVGGSKLFEKAQKSKTSVYFPILNLFVVLEMVDMSSFYGILFFIPVLNLYTIIKMSYRLGTVFNTSLGYKLGLVFLPIYFYPLLSFSDYKYKISDEEFFKALDNVKDENINLLTNEEIKEKNNEPDEPKVEVDSVFKSDISLKPKVEPYKAQKSETTENTINTIEEENVFKPIEVVKPPEPVKEEIKEEVVENKFVEDEKKKDVTEYLDL